MFTHNTWTDSPSIEELHSLLLNYDVHLKKQNTEELINFP